MYAALLLSTLFTRHQARQQAREGKRKHTVREMESGKHTSVLRIGKHSKGARRRVNSLEGWRLRKPSRERRHEHWALAWKGLCMVSDEGRAFSGQRTQEWDFEETSG